MATPTLDQIIGELEEWFKETMHNSVVSREVAVFNHVRGAFEGLKDRLATLIEGKPATPSLKGTGGLNEALTGETPTELTGLAAALNGADGTSKPESASKSKPAA